MLYYHIDVDIGQWDQLGYNLSILNNSTQVPINPITWAGLPRLASLKFYFLFSKVVLYTTYYFMSQFHNHRMIVQSGTRGKSKSTRETTSGDTKVLTTEYSIRSTTSMYVFSE